MNSHQNLNPATLADEPSIYDTDMSELDRSRTQQWIKENISPSDKRCRLSSYFLKHVLENDIALYTTNGGFKGGMVAAGYQPIDPHAVNWTFMCAIRNRCPHGFTRKRRDCYRCRESYCFQ